MDRYLKFIVAAFFTMLTLSMLLGIILFFLDISGLF